MFNGKMKAITFSYDDGVTQDRRLVEMMNRYGVKGTFNLNSEMLDTKGELWAGDIRINRDTVTHDEVKTLYAGHEVACHTLTHPNLTELSDEEVIRQVETDRQNLSRLAGYEVVGMAYPCGGENNNDHVAALIREHTGVRYCRTIAWNYSYAPQTNLYRFNPTVYHQEMDKMWELAEDFLKMEATTPQLLYIWGHSYEFDPSGNWGWFEEFLQFISGREDVFYGTNREVFGI